MQAMWPQEQQAGWPRNPASYALDSQFTSVCLYVHMCPTGNTRGLDSDLAAEHRHEQIKLQQKFPPKKQS